MFNEIHLKCKTPVYGEIIWEKTRRRVYTFECDTRGRNHPGIENEWPGPGGKCPELIKRGTDKLREMLRRE
jgi:hypothetical protein